MNISQAIRTGIHPDTGAKLNPIELSQLAQKHTELQAQLSDLFNPRQQVGQVGPNLSAATGVKQPPSTVRKLTDMFRITKPPAEGARETITPSTQAMTGMDGVPLAATQGRTVTGPVMTPTGKMQELQSISDKWRTLPGQHETQMADAKRNDMLTAIERSGLSPEGQAEAKQKFFGGGTAHPQYGMFRQKDGTPAWLIKGSPESEGLQAWVNQTVDVRKRQDFDAFKQQNPEYKGTFEQWGSEQTLKGHAAVPKPLSSDQQYLANQQQLAEGKPLTPEQHAFNLGYEKLIKTKTTDPKVAGYAAMAGSRITQTVDPNNPGIINYDSAAHAMRAHAEAPGSVDHKMAMPTGLERARTDLAISAGEQMGTMTDILKTRGDLFGPGAGHITDFTQWVGSQDPVAQRFRSAARITADHLAGVFGGRSEAALQGIYDVVGKNITNPAAAIAGIQQMSQAADTIKKRGDGSRNAPSTKGAWTIKGAMQLPSMKGKTAEQVRALLEAHGYTVKP